MTQRKAPRGTVIGLSLMLAAMMVLPFLDVVAKYLGQQGVPVMLIVWARMFFGAVMTLPFAVKIVGVRGLVPDRPFYHSLRAALLIAATGCFFWALHYLPIADALSIFFVQPLIVTVLSPIVLGEKVGIRRWVAVVIGFIGTLIIIRPGLQEINPGVGLALAAGACLAFYMLMTRKIAGQAHALVTTFHTSAIGAVVASVIAAYFWLPPSVSQWGLLVLLAFIATFGHFLIVRAYDFCEASLLAPLAYTEMVMATAAGWWFFGDLPDRWTFLGVAILISCAIYISVRERVNQIPALREFEQP